jgi:uncharacterized membrane protein YdjX (TVP38/TMEM64 family)
VSDPSNAPSRQPRWSFYRVAMVLFLLIWPGLLIWFGSSGWDTLKEWQQDGAAFDAYKERVRGWLDSLGPWAPLGFILIQALQVVVAPIPGEATGFLGGFLFGAAPGFLYSSLGLTLGSGLAFLISRWLGSRVVVKLFHSESLRKFDALFERNGALVSFLLFLFPGAPKDYLCYLLGLSKMPFKVFVALVAVGRMPATLLLSLQGAQVYLGHYWTFLLLLGITVVVGGILILFRERFYRWLRCWGASTTDKSA